MSHEIDINKESEIQAAKDMKKRDGETNMAVGIFLFVLGIPVLIGTMSAMDKPKAALINAVCGIVLLALGAGITAYGWRGFRKATRP